MLEYLGDKNIPPAHYIRSPFCKEEKAKAVSRGGIQLIKLSSDLQNLRFLSFGQRYIDHIATIG